MLATTIIVLREMLEVCLIVGMLFAALKTIENKRKIFFLGIGGGILLSIILALSFYKITNLFSGNGQEIISITILSLSIICIGLTILWIKNYVQSLSKKITNATQQKGVYPIIIVIALAITREGVELTLFLHGVAASGASGVELFSGFILGSLIGSILGILMYTGLLKFPTKYFFKIINVMLALLAAGMSTQLANYFTSTDLIDKLSGSVWNSSWLLSDASLMGKILHGLVGYQSNPTQLQLVFYITTLLIMLTMLKRSSKK